MAEETRGKIYLRIYQGPYDDDADISVKTFLLLRLSPLQVLWKELLRL